MILESEILQLPSRFVLLFLTSLSHYSLQASDRRTVARAASVQDPIHVDTGFIFDLGNYVNARQEEISVTVARFFYLFVKECSLLETYEVDNFILRNAGVLSSW